MNRVRAAVGVVALASLSSLALVAYLIWWIAWFNGGTTTVVIDFFGEEWIELGLLLVVPAVVAVALQEAILRIDSTKE